MTTARLPRNSRGSCGRCGWEGKLTTAAMAAFSQRRHRCDGHLAAAAAHTRAVARRAAIDRTPKPCLHKQANHQHGTYAAYILDRCRCQPCTAANTAYCGRLNKAKAYGRYDRLVDAEPARQHVRQLGAAGVGLKQVTRISGISGGIINKLMYGSPRADGTRRPPAARVKRETAERLLAVRPDQIAGGARVDATGTVRRLRALVAVGWSQAQIAVRLDMHPANFQNVIRARHVTDATRTRVGALYEQLWNTPPVEDGHRQKIAASRARRYAAEHGWALPMAWDDDTIDDPAARPDVSAFTRTVVCGECGKRLSTHPGWIGHLFSVHGIRWRDMAAPTVEDAGLDDALVEDAGLDDALVEQYARGEMRAEWQHKAPPELLEAVRRLAAVGYSARQIGDRIGMQTSAVSQLCSRHGIRTTGEAAA